MNTKRIGVASIVVSLLMVGSLLSTAQAEPIAVWGRDSYGEGETPPGEDFVAVAGGYCHSAALLEDGSAVAWGDNLYGQCDVPTDCVFTALSSGAWHCLALKDDDSLIAWGRNTYGQCTVPDGTNFVAIAAGGFHNLVLLDDGSLMAWGRNDSGQCNVPAGNEFVAVSAGGFHSVALTPAGTLTAWGSNTYGQCNVPEGDGFVSVASGVYHSLALRSDGSLVGWGRNDYGQADVPPGNDFVAMACGERNSLALTQDGVLMGWGRNDYGQCEVPPDTTFAAVAAGWFHSLAVIAEPTSHAPVAEDQTVETDEDTAVTITLQASDEDDDPLTFDLVTLTASGVLSGTPPELAYTPDLDFHGTDAFTFTASDATATSNVATVTITVVAVNDPPVAVALANGVEVLEVEETSWQGTSVLLDASASYDVDGDALAFDWDFTSDGTSDAQEPVVDATYPLGGPYTATVTVSDPSGATGTDTVTITVTPGPVENQLDILKTILSDGVTTGQIAPQIVSSCLAKLSSAERALEENKPNADSVAVSTLTALINQVSALSGKKIDPAIADEIIARASALIEELGG